MQRSRGAGAAGGSAATTSASRRCIAGESGLAAWLTALRKTRLPSPSRSRAASPGEKPVFRVLASTTGAPSRCSSASRTWAGSCSQCRRVPSAGTGLEEDTPPQLEVVVDALLDRVPDRVGQGHHEVVVVGGVGRIVLDVDRRMELDPPLAGQRDQA